MEFILLIIVVVIISAVSAAAKKKPKSSEEQDAPPPTMSDIQRAFMMTANVPEKHPAPYPPPTPPQAAPYSPPAPVYTDAVNVPSEVRTSPEPVAPTVAESYTGLGEEGFVTPMAAGSVSPFTDIKPAVYSMGEEKAAAPASETPAPKAAHIPLFEDQQDIVKAFIYAEILPRRAYPPRFR
jgi:hypothetical protein